MTWCDDPECSLGQTIVEPGYYIEGHPVAPLIGTCPACNPRQLDEEEWAETHGIRLDDDTLEHCDTCCGTGMVGWVGGPGQTCPDCHGTGGIREKDA